MKTFKKILKWSGLLFAVLLTVIVILVLIPEPVHVPAMEPGADTQYWNMSGQFRIAFRHLNGVDSFAAAPVLFLHGGPGGYVHSSVVKTLDTLTSRGHDVYLYDQRGSGRSDRLPQFSDINFEAHMQDLHEIVSEKIAAGPVILVAQSFGANFAAHYAARHPEWVKKVVFSSPGELIPPLSENGRYLDLDSVYPGPDKWVFREPYDFADDVKGVARHPKAMVATMGALLLDKKLVSDGEMDQMLNNLAAKFTRGMVCDTANVQPEEGGGGLYAYLATNNHDAPEVRDALRKSKVPIMVLQGQCDYVPFGAAYEYVDLFPKGEYVFIEDAGHEIWWEQEARFQEEIVQFLAKE